MRISATFTALIAAIAVSGCGKDAARAPEAAACTGDGIVATDAWVRAAHAGQPMSAGYVRLCNGGGEADRLIGATYEGAATTELHASSTGGDGMASMAPIEGGLDLPAGQAATLQPGGAHLMLIGLNHELMAGGQATITLQFENHAPMTLIFEVRSGAEDHSGH